MILEKIQTTNGLYDLEGTTIDGKPLKLLIPCFVTVDNRGNVGIGGRAVTLKHKNQVIEITRLIKAGTPVVCIVKSVFKDGTFIAHIHCFAGTILAWEKVIITTSKDKVDAYTKKIPAMQFELNGKQHFVIHSSYVKTTEDEDEKAVNDFAFSIMGNESCIDIEKLHIDSNLYYKEKTERKRRDNSACSNYFLVEGALEFMETYKFISDYEKTQLEALIKNGGSYLGAWKKYTVENGNAVLERAKKVGKIGFKLSCEILKSKNSADEKSARRLILSNELSAEVKQLLENESITIYRKDKEDPFFLSDSKITWNDYLIKLKEKKKSEDKKTKSQKYIPIEAKIKTIKDEKSIDIDIDRGGLDGLQEGFFVLSTLGEQKQIERQTIAWEKIANGTAGIQHLGALLETEGRIFQTQQQRKEVNVSQDVFRKIFKNPPTLNQKQAIQVALRTPDIALIQGPPGTGKTTVITAILEQLNIMQDKHSVYAGKVLATSYQHDAVINMIDRLRINSLPTFKWGKKSKETDAYLSHISQWANKIAGKVKEKNPHLKISTQATILESKLLNYKMGPSNNEALDILNYLRTNICMNSSIQDKANKLYSTLQKDGSMDTNEKEKLIVLHKIRGLRITKDSFDDDGKERAKDVYFVLDSNSFFKNEEEKNLLRQACTLDSEGLENNTAFFTCMKQLKLDLLKRFSSKPKYVEPKANPELVDLAETAINYIIETESKSGKQDKILATWISILDGNYTGLEDAIKECDFVYAATAQQAVANEITNQKKLIDETMEGQLYDTVIIDEAARAAPPDLLIPMCLAAKRIILVGDHRQLPQLVDEDICKTIETDELSIAEKALQNNTEIESTEKENSIKNLYERSLKLSLFELLFERLKSLEKKDGIPRTTTLGSQFRTHPLLGEFVSNEFYKPYGEGYASPRKAEEFSHSLPKIENKAAVWIDVSNKQGAEKKRGTSWSRKSEVDKIIEYLSLFIKSDQGKDLSYGIITFYKGQADLIKEQVKRLKIPENKLKIGSVDSFQGMEFDVVFLSVVRSSTDKRKNPYGFLCSVNRLCVSMSRQKKVLICVGDKDFCTSKKARQDEGIPALAHFSDLCETSEYGVVL
ncbi:MAG: AAA domain-containing protein [Treponemataceae bacterium]